MSDEVRVLDEAAWQGLVISLSKKDREIERLRAALVVAETNLERLEASLSGDWIGRAMFPISEWRAAVVKALKGEGE